MRVHGRQIAPSLRDMSPVVENGQSRLDRVNRFAHTARIVGVGFLAEFLNMRGVIRVLAVCPEFVQARMTQAGTNPNDVQEKSHRPHSGAPLRQSG